MTKENFDCLILGAGPAGLSSAMYCARANLNCAILDMSAFGGCVSNFYEIENYLGFNKIQGWELAQKFEKHIDLFNIKKFPFEEIESIDLISPIKKIKTLNREFNTKSVIIATGAKNKKLNVLGEKENLGKGVSYCAVCDGAFYKDKTVAVVGGGNSALEEALYLTRFVKKLYLIHRRDEFRADAIIQKRVKENKKIELVLNSTVDEILAKEKVNAIRIKNVLTGKTKELSVEGVFPYIGLEPNSKMFSGQIEQDKFGFIITDNTMKTNVEGVFAVGDVRNTPLRQVITAVSDGAIAGVEVAKYLMEIKEEAIK